jgi:hypothetical protein
LLVLDYSWALTQIEIAQESANLPYMNPMLSPEQRATDFVRRMTLQEKAIQMLSRGISPADSCVSVVEPGSAWSDQSRRDGVSGAQPEEILWKPLLQRANHCSCSHKWQRIGRELDQRTCECDRRGMVSGRGEWLGSCGDAEWEEQSGGLALGKSIE